MISIIVSSIDPAKSLDFRRNIAQTIGVDYELFIHDNRETKWGLCKLYNHYAAQSHFDILCFMHEDILFHTSDWGMEVIRFFGSHPQAGVLGFAGSIIKTEYTTGWGSYRDTTREHVIQHFSNGKIRKLYANPNKEDYSPVVLIDGLAMITTKAVWHEHPFDEVIFQRFHSYDLDFSMQVAENYTNYVCHTIDVEHFSNGSYSSEWFTESKKFTTKVQNKLPFCAYPLSPKFIRQCQRFDAYQAVRIQLRHSDMKLDLRSIVKLMNRVDTFPYKFKLIKHIWKAKRRK